MLRRCRRKTHALYCHEFVSENRYLSIQLLFTDEVSAAAACRRAHVFAVWTLQQEKERAFTILVRARALRGWLFRLRNPTPTPKFFLFWLRLRLQLREKKSSPSDSSSDSEKNFSRSPVWTPKNSEIFYRKKKTSDAISLWNEGRAAQ